MIQKARYPLSWNEAALSNKALKISLFFGCRDTCAFALMQTSAARKGGLSYFSPSQDINLVSVLQSPKLPHISLENIPEQTASSVLGETESRFLSQIYTSSMWRQKICNKSKRFYLSELQTTICQYLTVLLDDSFPFLIPRNTGHVWEHNVCIDFNLVSFCTVYKQLKTNPIR